MTKIKLVKSSSVAEGSLVSEPRFRPGTPTWWLWKYQMRYWDELVQKPSDTWRKDSGHNYVLFRRDVPVAKVAYNFSKPHITFNAYRISSSPHEEIIDRYPNVESAFEAMEKLFSVSHDIPLFWSHSPVLLP